MAGQDTSGFLSNTEPVSRLKAKRAVCFAGLADNRQFFETLQRSGCTPIRTFSFSDHHRYTRSDLDAISAQAVKQEADVVVTSFKDGVKLEPSYSWPVPLVVVDAEIELIGNENQFLNILTSILRYPSRGNY